MFHNEILERNEGSKCNCSFKKQVGKPEGGQV